MARTRAASKLRTGKASPADSTSARHERPKAKPGGLMTHKKKEARASAARLRSTERRDVAPPSDAAGSDKLQRAHETPAPLRMTPRPDLTVPIVSVENVDWEDPHEPLSPLQKWELAERGLQKRLEEFGAASSRARFEARDGRMSFSSEDGVFIADARAQVIALFVAPTHADPLDRTGRLVMAWADPALSSVGVARLEEMGDMLPVDVTTARELVLRAAEASCCEHVMTLTAPQGETYFGLRALRGSTSASAVTPGSPVGTVLRGLSELRRAISQRDEPTDVLRARFLNLGKTLVMQSESTYRESEWAGRVQRAGKVLIQLASRLVPPTFTAIAAGRQAEEWLNQSVAVDLADSVRLLEDEWGAFA